MKKTTIALSLGAGLGILVSAGAASADKLKDVTCDQFLAMDESQQEHIVYWINGIEAGSSKKGVDAGDIDVAYDAFGQPIAAVVTACEADKKASLWDKIKEHF
jgi:predicted GTPase